MLIVSGNRKHFYSESERVLRSSRWWALLHGWWYGETSKYANNKVKFLWRIVYVQKCSCSKYCYTYFILFSIGNNMGKHNEDQLRKRINIVNKWLSWNICKIVKLSLQTGPIMVQLGLVTNMCTVLTWKTKTNKKRDTNGFVCCWAMTAILI